jgi:hypothetical protein
MRQYTKQLIINSADRISASTSTSNFSVKLDRTIDHVHKIGVRKVIFPFSYYVFTFSNNIIKFDEGGGILTAIITPGNYTASELEIEIKNRMDTAGVDTYTITISDNTYLITISSTGTFSLDFTVANSANDPLGFAATTYGTAGSQTSPNAVNLNGPHMLFLKSRELSGGVRGYTNFINVMSTVFFTIPINKLPNEIVYTEPSIPQYTQYVAYRGSTDGAFRSEDMKKGRTIRDIDIELVDGEDNNINLNGRDIIIVLDVIGYDD